MLAPTTSEYDYYAQILDRFQKLDNPRNLDVFISHEIIKVLRESKQKITSNIVKNTIIMLLALYKQDNHDSFQNFTEFDKPQQDMIQKELLSLIYV